MFYICSENSVGNTGMFLAIPEQCLYNVEVFYFFSSDCLTKRKLGVHKKMEGDTAKTADPN